MVAGRAFVSSGILAREGNRRIVMAGHSRSKNGVASLAYVPAIHVDARDEPGHDAECVVRFDRLPRPQKR
jgi:hypothetical protein